jgi:hypothetical protein
VEGNAMLWAHAGWGYRTLGLALGVSALALAWHVVRASRSNALPDPVHHP